MLDYRAGHAAPALILVDQHDEAAASCIDPIVQLHVFALELVAGRRAVAGGEGEAVQADDVGMLNLAWRAARAQCQNDNSPR